MAKTQNTDTTKRWRAVEQPALSFIAGGNANGAAALEDGLVVSYKTKHTLILRSSNYTPCYLDELKWIENYVYPKTCT